MAYSAESGDRENRAIESREWLLGCEGFRVEDPDGLIGHVVRVLYEPSARWDRPSGLVVRGASGSAVFAMSHITAVVASEGRIVLSKRAASGPGPPR